MKIYLPERVEIYILIMSQLLSFILTVFQLLLEFFDAWNFLYSCGPRNSRDCRIHLGGSQYFLSAGGTFKEMLIRRQKMKLCCICALFPSLLREF